MTWRLLAACRGMDPEMFFPERGESVGPAMDVCRTCPVTEQCLAEAIEADQPGIWGGTTQRQRRRLRRGRTRECANATCRRPFLPRGPQFCCSPACAAERRRAGVT